MTCHSRGKPPCLLSSRRCRTDRRRNEDPKECEAAYVWHLDEASGAFVTRRCEFKTSLGSCRTSSIDHWCGPMPFARGSMAGPASNGQMP
eukprot:4950989-Pleurochrysis_carterae.AAC.1